jgi:methylmalonyl-CoA mutase C-terminal domain/subunit
MAKVKVLMAQFPLETHNRGLITVTGMLRDAGMEVIMMGNALPDNVITAAMQESADVVGISTYCGGELALGKDLMEAAKKKGIEKKTVFLIGGIFPPKDIPELEKIGFSGAFLSATKAEIVDCINAAVAKRK